MSPENPKKIPATAAEPLRPLTPPEIDAPLPRTQITESKDVINPNIVTLKEAQILLVENFLTERFKPKSLAPELFQKIYIEDDSTVPARDFIMENRIFKTKKAAYIHANALGVLLYEMEKKAETLPLTEADCRYVVSPQLREEMEIEWGVHLAEKEGDESYYRIFL